MFLRLLRFLFLLDLLVVNLLLRQPVWLTTDQRQRLRAAAVKALQHRDSDIQYCESILRELLDSTHREAGMTRLVGIIIAGLQMPEDIVPVYLCELEVEQLINFGGLDVPLSKLLRSKNVYKKGSVSSE